MGQQNTIALASPNRIVDLHAHLFNARCLPLRGIIADIFGHEAHHDIFAQLAAAALNLLVERDNIPLFKPPKPSKQNTDEVSVYISAMQDIVGGDLLALSGAGDDERKVKKIEDSDLYKAIVELGVFLKVDARSLLASYPFLKRGKGWATLLPSANLYLVKC